MSKRDYKKYLISVCGIGVIAVVASLLLFGSSKATLACATIDSVCEAMPPNAQEPAIDSPVFDSIPVGAQILMDVYPDFVKGFQDGNIILTDGSTMVFDDKKEKTFVQKLDDADLEDMFAFNYDRLSWTPGFMQDAGRSRCEAFFKKMYGASAAQVRKHLVNVPWFGQQVQFTTVNHAADSLRAVASELAKYPELKQYLKSSGSFYWRKVRGANRQSAHSYGMTIDIGVKYSDYWLWKNPGKKETDKITYANRIPHKIVEVFERHGFIWGGRWYHYDTMHFEFRPEILR